MRLCSMLVCFDYFCRDFRFRLCGRISWSVSSRLSLTSPLPSSHESIESSINTNERKPALEDTLSAPVPTLLFRHSSLLSNAVN